ncbi:hypothetical protein MOV10_14355 [Salmonella enterica subsp. enterica serovar Abeokuta]|uniref:Uncharacterized protein n=1 Tax=Salmonella enterica subsp. enterica serovar Abeokuta TaxID=2926665 RepID=A0A8T9IE59_SALET|nr:hypothetical protein [Salmonella enterica]UNO32320.1 hypothetical protein MOV10_14355 [Salmonella enterica subsp. enterica serovar Abeokuta]HAK2208019.1 hypothetical protein [Salmonella enterica]
MSHFSVLIIGNNPEEALAPFHEFECTGIDDQYIQEIDITEEIRGDIESECSVESAVSYHLGDNKSVTSDSLLDLAETHKYGYAIVRDGELIKAVKRTNPNKKWDWYQIGGRWSGFFLHRSGMCVDSIKKSDIDFTGMIADKAIVAKRNYEAFAAAITGHEYPRSWPSIMETLGKDNIDQARDIYHSQPALNAIKKAGLNFLFKCPVEHFGHDEQAFVTREASSFFSPYAIIHEGVWIAKGEMGWFGMSDDDVTQEEWNEKVFELIRDLPDDAILSVYDCHI